jgi:hypothetical protein
MADLIQKALTDKSYRNSEELTAVAYSSAEAYDAWQAEEGA